jgi:hypothetical protein
MEHDSRGHSRLAAAGRAVPQRRRVHYWLALVGATTALLSPLQADAAKVTGTIENFRLLENPVWAEAKEPKKHGYSFRELVPTVRAEFRKLFPHIPKELCVAAIGTQKQKPPKPILIRVGGGRTTPVTIVVPPGTQLQFQNTDPFKHRLYGVGISTFPANDTARGGTREWAVPGEGVFEIRDELAPSLRMWIIGEPNVAAIAYPSMKGEFVLSVADPGDYTIQTFFAGKKVGQPKPVRVEAKDIDVRGVPVADPKAKPAPEAKPEAKPENKEKGE